MDSLESQFDSRQVRRQSLRCGTIVGRDRFKLSRSGFGGVSLVADAVCVECKESGDKRRELPVKDGGTCASECAEPRGQWFVNGFVYRTEVFSRRSMNLLRRTTILGSMSRPSGWADTTAIGSASQNAADFLEAAVALNSGA